MNLQQITEDDILRALLPKSFYDFFLEFWSVISSEELVNNWHIKYLCDELQKTADTVIERKPKNYDLVINIPPGSSKSSIVTVMFPAWLWTRDQSLTIISSSYSAMLSVSHSQKSRDIIQSDKYKRLFPDIQLREDQNNKGHYKNKEGGERMTTSSGGTVTGYHGHFIILDDPLNAQGAMSTADRKMTNEYIQHTLNTRKIDKAVTVTILVMQRLHQDDPTGLLLSQGGVKHICLPAELSQHVSPPKLKEQYIDGLLDPIRMSRDVLGEMKVKMGSYAYAGQMQQQPAPEGDGIWKYEWFNVIEEEKIPKNLTMVGTDWDLAYTTKDSNSASAWVTGGTIDGKIYITDLGFEWLEFPDLVKKMTNKPAPHYIEGKASGKSAKQTLAINGINAIEVQATTDKISRARLATPTVEAGRVYITKKLLDILFYDQRQGLSYFPNGSHDDLADAFSQSIVRLSKPKFQSIISSRNDFAKLGFSM